MKCKDYIPIELKLYQSNIELLMEILDSTSHPASHIIKYNIQCKIDQQVANGDWI